MPPNLLEQRMRLQLARRSCCGELWKLPHGSLQTVQFVACAACLHEDRHFGRCQLIFSATAIRSRFLASVTRSAPWAADPCGKYVSSNGQPDVTGEQ